MIVDTLVVELGLDPKKFTDAQKDALNALRRFEEGAENQGRRVEAQTKRLNDVLQNFKRETLSTLGLFVGGYGLKEMIQNVTNLDASTGRFARTLGVGTRELSNWQGLFKTIGADVGGAQAALGGLNSALVRFKLGAGLDLGLATVSSLLDVDLFDQKGEVKSATQFNLDAAAAIKRRGMSDRDAAGLLAMLPGMTQDMINALLLPDTARRLAEVDKAGGTTDPSAQAAERLQKNFGLLGTAVFDLYRMIVGKLEPVLSRTANALTNFIEKNPSLSAAAIAAGSVLGIGSLGAVVRGASSVVKGSSFIVRGGMAVAGWMARKAGARVLGPAGLLLDADPAAAPTLNPNPLDPYMGPKGGTRRPSPEGMAAFIRKEALARSIDPDIAVEVARREGLFAYNYSESGQSFVPGEQSFGPFQLNYAKNGRSLGDLFTRKTGLDARDSSTWQEQVKFSLDEARRGGWGPWHGWKGPAWAGIGPGGGPENANNSTSTTVNIGDVHVNAPNAKDAAGVAREIGPQLRREVTAGFANAGAQ